MGGVELQKHLIYDQFGWSDGQINKQKTPIGTPLIAVNHTRKQNSSRPLQHFYDPGIAIESNSNYSCGPNNRLVLQHCTDAPGINHASSILGEVARVLPTASTQEYQY